MSFREKTHWVALIVIVAAFGWYFIDLHTVRPQGPGHMAASGGMLTLVTIGIILAMSIVIGIIAALDPKEAHRKSDERDRAIHWRGTHYAYYPIVIGVWLCIGAIFYGFSVATILHSLLAVVVIAEVVRIGSQLWLYRRGLVMTDLPFTNSIRTLRFLTGEMTQADLGEQVGVTRQTIAAIEQGKYSPSLETAFRIAAIFGKPVDEVFVWQEGAD